MPIIEFKSECGKVFEKIFPFSKVKDNMKATCPDCGKPAPRILFSRTLEPLMYGNPEGYGKPAAGKRHSYKLAAQSGNAGAI
jgi:putative FmdB family regulatory protein